MPREIITIQVGQCGNQLGLRWWDVMLQEHKANPQYPEARDALFTQVSDPDRPHVAGSQTNSSLKARCVAIDMEQGVLRSMLRGPLQALFDSTYFISDVSGAGNNWAVGHMEYGDTYLESITDAVQQQVERCDCVQSFLVMHSLSGGTGSGLGTRVLGMLEDEFPHVFRICPVVVPSLVDDVVTAPYNSCFALKELIEHADCVLPMDNDALARMTERALGRRMGAAHAASPPSSLAAEEESRRAGESAASRPSGPHFNAAQPTQTKNLPYEGMNAMAAQMLSNFTCAMRFPGPLNMDINEVTTNLVPYPRLHMLTTAMAPLSVSRHSGAGPRTVDAMFAACLERSHQLLDLDGRVPGSSSDGREAVGSMTHGGSSWADTTMTSPSSAAAALPAHRRQGMTLATALIARGPQVTVGDLARNVQSMRERLCLPYWNEDGFKTALCGVSPLGHRDSVLLISNNCTVAEKVDVLYKKFMRLYSVRSHMHHYEPYLSNDYFDHTADTIQTMIDDYRYLASAVPPSQIPRSMRDLVYF